MMTREKFLVINRMDADELRETLSEVLENNAKLRALVDGMEWCKIEDAEAEFCPLYDEDEPFRCKKERYLKEVGLAESVSDVSINDSQTLRSCPFCGGKARIHRWSIPNAENCAQVRCESITCGARGYEACECMTQDEVDEIAIAAWNKRVE